MASPTLYPEVKIMFARGAQPDVRLQVLGQVEYHVHSVILKLQSQFFFKFLDPPNKTDSTTELAPGLFKYEWITKVDEDRNGWSLVAAEDNRINIQTRQALKKGNEEELCNFDNFICALYGTHYRLNDLAALCKLADYYCALPAVSKTLSDAMISCYYPDYTKDVSNVVKIAVKFRHRRLFADCIAVLAGKRPPFGYGEPDLSLPGFSHLDAAVCKTAEIVQSRIDQKIASVHSHATRRCAQDASFKRTLEGLEMNCQSMPMYYRQTIERVSSAHLMDGNKVGRMELSSLMSQDLSFVRRECRAGEGEFVNYFLCGVIHDDELPWDVQEIDW